VYGVFIRKVIDHEEEAGFVSYDLGYLNNFEKSAILKSLQFLEDKINRASIKTLEKHHYIQTQSICKFF